MAQPTMIRTATLAALVVMTLLGSGAPVSAADPGPRARIVSPTVQIHSDKAAQFLPLGVGKSIVVDVPGDIKDVLVADPKIANAVVRTARRAYIIGVAIGQTNVYFFDSEGRQLMGFDIAVAADLSAGDGEGRPLRPLADDLGPSNDPKHFENRPYYNFGCASQRNLAAMVANPHDMVQPRAETPPWTAKRTFGTEKWRKGESPATIYADSNKGAISDLGK
jgi:Pilus biogenesis CpaD protein (pilus_cpaD)/Pilus formation protein N terminal region